MTAQEMWKQYGGHGAYETVGFGDGSEADVLADLVLQGKKRATTSAYYWIQSGEDKLPRSGDCCVVLDSKHNAVCVIKTTRVYVTEFCKVSAEHAALEGEGDHSLDYWRREHRRFFSEDLAGTGQAFSDDMFELKEV